MKTIFTYIKQFNNDYSNMVGQSVQPIVEFVNKHNELPEILAELNKSWESEQQKRAQFLNDITTSEKGEFIQGEIVMHCPAKWKHTQVIRKLSFLLDLFLKENKIGEFAVEKLMVSLTRNDFEPDLVFYKNEKANIFVDNQLRFPAPDFVVEVLSESTAVRDRGVKFEDYAAHGVQEYWIIDTEKEEVEQYILFNGKYELYEKLHNNKIVNAKAIEGFSITVSDLFT